MRIIQLRRTMGKTPYEFVLRLKCGPNFVMNRAFDFKRMIREQGTTFWFRFWLTFCYQPGCKNLELLMKHGWYDPVCYGFAHLHKNFVQETKPLHKKPAIEQFAQVTFDMTMMAFGCALCELFFKWIKASEITNKCTNYWLVPVEYLDQNFVPTILEKYLVQKWKFKLVSLLGVDEKQVPWVQQLLQANESDLFYFPTVKQFLKDNTDQILIVDSETNHKTCCNFIVANRHAGQKVCLSCMRKKLHDMKMSIKNVDESLAIKKKSNASAQIVKSRYLDFTPISSNKCSESMDSSSDSVKVRKAVKSVTSSRTNSVKSNVFSHKTKEMRVKKCNSKSGKFVSVSRPSNWEIEKKPEEMMEMSSSVSSNETPVKSASNKQRQQCACCGFHEDSPKTIITCANCKSGCDSLNTSEFEFLVNTQIFDWFQEHDLQV